MNTTWLYDYLKKIGRYRNNKDRKVLYLFVWVSEIFKCPCSKRDNYTIYKSIYDQVINDSKRSYYDHQLLSTANPSKDNWHVVRALVKRLVVLILSVLIWETLLISLSSTSLATDKVTPHIPTIPTNNNISSFFFQPTDINEL